MNAHASSQSGANQGSLTTTARGRKLLLAFALLFTAAALLVLSTFALVPYAVKSYAPSWIKEKTGRELTVAHATFNPFTLRFNVSKLALNDGTRTLASFDELGVKGAWSSIWNAAWTVDELVLSKPVINVHTAGDGSLDWIRFLDDISDKESAKETSDSIPRLILRNIAISNGAVRLSDERVGNTASVQRRIEFAPLTFKLDKLSTLPRDRGDYALDATLNDQTRVQWRGRVGGNPIESSGDLSITHLPLSKISAMANMPLPVELAGTASLKANYTAAFGSDFFALGMGGGELVIEQLRATQEKDEVALERASVSPLSLSFARTETTSNAPQSLFAVEPLMVSVRGGVVRTRENLAPLVSFNELLTESPVSIGVTENKVAFPQIAINGLIAQLNRRSDGSVDLPFDAPLASSQGSGTPSAAPPKTTPTESATRPWQLEIGEVAATGARLSISDLSFVAPQTANALLDVSLGARAVIGERATFGINSKLAQIRDLSVRDSTSSSEWLSIKEVRAEPFAFDSVQQNIELPKIEIVAPQISATLTRSGIDLANKLSPAVNTPPRAAAAKNDAARQITLAGIVLSNGRVTLTDSSLPTAQVHTLQELRVNAEKFPVNGAAPISISATAALASGGALLSKLRVDQKKNTGEIEYAVEKVALAPFSSYLNQNTKLKIAKGEAAAKGVLMFSPTSGNNETLRVQTSATLRDVELLDETNNQPFAQWAELSTTDAKLMLAPSGLSVSLADLLLDQPRGRAVIGEDRKMNLTQIAKTNAPQSAPPPTDTAAQAEENNAVPLPADGERSTRVSVARVQVTGGDIEFADLSLRPQFGTRISDLSGLIVGLSTDVASRAEVSLEGKVDQFGLARLTGTIAPARASQYTDLKATFRNLEMANLTPYSGKFAGRKIESGKLSLDLDYKVEARKLKGENQVIIDNIKLGERVDSPEATNLPLDLAIALLRDSNGMIDLGIPVQGSLDDPQFSYSSLVWKAIVNVLGKIATAPFRALGALLGGTGEEFEAVIFEPGEARLLPPEREKLAKLANALEKRPSLKLAIEPRFDKGLDRDALADNILKLEIGKRAGLKPPGPNEPLIISFTDAKVQSALDELAATAGDDPVRLRAKYLPAPSNAITGLIQNARERVTERGRNEAAEARAKYYPELFALLKSKQTVPDIAYEALATLRGQAVQNTLTGVNKFDSARVSVAAPSAAKNVKPGQVPTQLALAVK
jgi:hypothetical protein